MTLSAAVKRIFRRPPDFIVEGDHGPYLRRWHLLPRNRFCNVYLHHFVGDDPDRALHDHPWHSVSIILKGGYEEILPCELHGSRCTRNRKRRRPGQVIYRKPEQAHRVVLFRKQRGGVYGTAPYTNIIPAWTIFITGPWKRHWGFHCPNGWRHWRDFVDRENPGKTGQGCMGPTPWTDASKESEAL